MDKRYGSCCIFGIRRKRYRTDPVFGQSRTRKVMHTEIVGSVDADGSGGESEPPAQTRAGQEARESFAPFRSGATATKRRTPRQKSEPRTSPPGRRE